MADHYRLRSQIRDFRKRSIQAAGPGRREFSELIDGKRVYLYAIRDMENPHPLLHEYLDRIDDGSQWALIYKDLTKEGLPAFWSKCPWEMFVNGRLRGPFEEEEIDDAMVVEILKSR